MAGCDECAKPAAFWDGKPSGKESVLNGVQAYVAEPTGRSNKAVVLVPDIHGWDLANSRLLVDKFAAKGFTTALPDLFGDDSPDLAAISKGDTSGFLEWIGRKSPDVIIPDLDKVVNGLRSEYGAESIGVIGICWGGRFAVILGSTNKVKAVVMNHGSFVDYTDISNLKQPTLINASDKDQQISREKLSQFQGILEGKKGLPSDVKFYPGMGHGWTVKGDVKDPEVGPQVVDAFDRAAAWFQEHL